MDGFDIDGLLPILCCHRTGMGAETAAHTTIFHNDRTQLVQGNGLLLVWTDIKTGSTDGETLPGIAEVPIYYCYPHAGLFLTDLEQGTGGTDLNTFHTEIAGNLFGSNNRGSGIDTCPNIQQRDRAIGTDLDTAAAANTLAGKDLFGHGPGRTQPVSTYR